MESLPFGFLFWHRVIGNHNALFFRQPSCEALWVSNSGQRPQGRVFFCLPKSVKARRISKNTPTGQYKNDKKSLLRHVETCPVEGFPF